jgi:hypothetical protein
MTTRDKANFSFTSDAVWLRLLIDNSSVNTIVKHLRINYPLLDHVDAYLIHQGELVQHKYLNDRVPYNEDRQHDKYYLFNYTLRSFVYLLYLEYLSEFPFIILQREYSQKNLMVK